MPRRTKTLVVFVAIAIFAIFYLTVRYRSPFPLPQLPPPLYRTNISSPSQNSSRRAATQARDFYSTTLEALNAQDAETARKLEESRLAAKKGAKPEAAGPAKPLAEAEQIPIEVEIPQRDDGEGAEKAKEKGVAGRRKMKGGEKWDMASGKEAAMQVDKAGDGGKEKETKETKEEHEVEVELNAILKKGPSKSFPIHIMGEWPVRLM